MLPHTARPGCAKAMPIFFWASPALLSADRSPGTVRRCRPLCRPSYGSDHRRKDRLVRDICG